jgi:drug/metabolite transporter (DMT)-like permease
VPVVLLVLVSAFLHALWNALLKRQPDKQVAGLAVIALATGTAAAAALVVAALGGEAPFATPAGLGYSLAAGVFEGGYFASLILALEHAQLGLAYTVSRGVAILLVWPLSVALLGEQITPLALAGTAVLAAGLAAAGVDRAAPDRRGLLFACLCGAFIAGYHLCYKGALAHSRSPAAVYAVSLAVALPMNFARLGWRPGRRRVSAVAAAVRARPAALVGAGVVCTGSFLAFLVALRSGGAGFVLTLRNTSILFATLLAPIAGERPTRRQVAGAALVAGGAVLLGLGR